MLHTIDAVLCTDNLLKGVVGFRTDFECLCEARRASGEEHELLEGKLIASVGATIDDVERGTWEHVWGLNTGEFRKVLV